MLAALAISQLISGGVLLLDRRILLRSMHQAEALDKLSNLAKLVRAAPEPLRGQVLGFAADETFQPELAPTFAPGQGRRDEKLTLALQQRLGAGPLVASGVYVSRQALKPRLVIDAEPRPSASMVSSENARDALPSRPDQQGQPIERLEALVQIGPGQWLGMRMLMPPQQPLPTAYWSFLPLALLAVAGASVWAAGRVARPLRRLAMAADGFAPGTAPSLLPVSGPADVRRSIQAYNAMSRRLADAFEIQRNILMAVGHDLRTPIASLRVRAEFIDDPCLRGRIAATLDDMEALTRAALSAATRGFTGEEARRIDLAALAESLCADLADAGLAVRFVPGDAVEAICRSSEIRRALRNLIDNAVFHGEGAEVSVTQDSAWARIQVKDEGPGVPEADLERVLAPFERLEPARSHDGGGSGLGLAIVDAIARGHGGQVVLSNRPQGGLCVMLSLPSAADTA